MDCRESGIGIRDSANAKADAAATHACARAKSHAGNPTGNRCGSLHAGRSGVEVGGTPSWRAARRSRQPRRRSEKRSMYR